MTTLLDFSAGVATGDDGKTLSGRQIVNAVTSGRSIKTIVNPGNNVDIPFASVGDAAFRIVPTEDCEISFSGGNTGELQFIDLLIQQPATGNCTITWADNITWVNGTSFVDSRMGVVSCFRIMWDGMSTYYGGRVFG